MRTGSDLGEAREDPASSRREFELLEFKDGEGVEEFSLHLATLVTRLGELGQVMEDVDVVSKFLRVEPPKFSQLAQSIETLIDLNTLTIEDVVGRFKVQEDRQAQAREKGERLYLAEGDRRGSSSRRGGGQGRGRRRSWRSDGDTRGDSRDERMDTRDGRPDGRDGKDTRVGRPNSRRVSYCDRCHKCGEKGHWARDCKAPRRQERVHLVEEEDDEGPALLMAQVCALQEVEAEAQGKQLDVHEPRAQVLLGEEEKVTKAEQRRWYLDSGASNHMIGRREDFAELDTAITGSVKFGDGSRVTIHGRGTVLFKCQNGDHRALTDVYYIPQLRTSIASLGQLDARGCEVLIKHGILTIHDRELQLLTKVKRSINRMMTRPGYGMPGSGTSASRPWPGSREGMARGMPRIEHVEELCDSCLAGKQRRSPFTKKAKYRASDRLELVHGDLCGPISPATHGGRKYFLLLVDDTTRFMWLRLLSSKDEAPEAIKHFQAKVEAETGNKLKVLRTDRSGEFTSVEFGRYCADEGVERHLTAPYSPQQNGVVERRNQTIVGMARSMLKAKKMPVEFWGEAVNTAVFILNRAPTKSLKGMTPFEAWHGRKPDVSFMHTFGCIGHVKNVKPHLGKLEDRSTPMVFLGYEQGSKAYRLYDPRAERVHISRDVVFDEGASWSWEASGAEEDGRGWSSFTIDYTLYRGAGEAVGDGGADAGEAEQSGSGQAEQEAPAEPQSPPTPIPATHGTPTSAKAGSSVRFVTPPPGAAEYLDADYDNEPLRFRAVDNIIGDASPPGQAVRNLDGELFMASAEELCSLEEAEADARWRRAMEEEMASIEKNKMWELVDPPVGCKPIGLKWVYKVKKNERGDVVKHKARLVAKGFVQREGIDFEEVFAPVARMDAVRLLLALAATRDWSVHHLDVKSAFLNGELTEVVHVRQPPRFIVAGEEGKVLRLRKALYGLRQAPRTWNIKLDTTLATLGFKKCSSEHALYTRRSKEGILIVGVYVDDLIVTGSEQQEIKKFKSEMAAKFKMSDLGLLTYYLGIEGKQAIELCQSAYALKLLERAGLSTAEKVDATHYRSLVGGLRYLTHTRPNITFAVGYVSRFMEDPRKDHMAAVKHLLRYIAGTCALGLAYPRRKKTSDLHLFGFSDSDMGGDIDGRKSTSGMVFFLETCPISWQSQKQKIVALSTCEAEYISGAAAACHGIWLRRLLEDITGQTVAAPILRIDNKSAIELAKNPVFHSRSKHIDIKFHFIRDCVERKQVVLEQVGTEQQLADVFTKPLGKNNFKKLKSQMGMVTGWCNHSSK
ncbi:LOW QUALITY PROTEIN: hypothetical protein U9M48_026940 [Paspalum notatum var. saurae]|uniref:Uncharacterized protein n=1 Tax=Paspalum notatum var. saurae TaxID=547442 RepID=A0AAQ3TTP5_PASNO